jgi:alpha-L-rhamnosidase
MGNSIKFIYDIHNLYNKVIDDMIEAQLDNGLVPDIAPEYVPFVAGFRDSPEWGSACVILPWDMYEWYGDTEAVRKAFPMMKKYVDYLKDKSQDNILSHGLGDWYDLGPKFPGEAQLTPKAVTATSIYFNDAKLLGKMAALLGFKEDAAYYSGLAEEIRLAFNSKFLDPVTKIYSTGSQTAYAMPLFFEMADDSLRTQISANLRKSIIENDKALTAGDIGYRYLLRVLEQEGESQLIYEMNSKTDVPGYGFQLSKGATSLTESWAALKYVSNNHMMLGHLMEWLYSGLGGIRQAPGSAAYDTILIEPDIVGDISWVEATYNSIRGEIASSWKKEDHMLIQKISIPAGCNALIVIPQPDPAMITENDILLKDAPDISILPSSDGKTWCRVFSGGYIFRSKYSN